MREERDKRSAQQGDPDDDEGPMAGERLRQARHEQQISVLEVAKELHLDEPKVRALERNEFDVLGAPVFAKGHLRKYARCTITIGVGRVYFFVLCRKLVPETCTGIFVRHPITY